VQALQAILEQAQSGDDIAAALMAIIGWLLCQVLLFLMTAWPLMLHGFDRPFMDPLHEWLTKFCIYLTTLFITPPVLTGIPYASTTGPWLE
jgi:hypothetical protein